MGLFSFCIYICLDSSYINVAGSAGGHWFLLHLSAGHTQVTGLIQGKSSVFYVRPQMIKRHISVWLLTTPLPICHLRVVSFNAAASASSEGALSPAQRAPLHSLILFEFSERAGTFVQVADLWANLESTSQP